MITRHLKDSDGGICSRRWRSGFQLLNTGSLVKLLNWKKRGITLYELRQWGIYPFILLPKQSHPQIPCPASSKVEHDMEAGIAPYGGLRHQARIVQIAASKDEAVGGRRQSLLILHLCVWVCKNDGMEKNILINCPPRIFFVWVGPQSPPESLRLWSCCQRASS